ncbi:MAG: penicillin-binding protein activator, partial [Rickettsiales bacterium]
MIKRTIITLFCLGWLTSCGAPSYEAHNSSLSLPTHYALLLPLTGQWKTEGQTVRDGFLHAYYESPTRDQQTISFYDTAQKTTIEATYQKAVSDGADFIIGPLVKEDVQALLKQDHFPVPVLALNYTVLLWGHLPNDFYEFGLSPADEGQQIADKAWQAGARRALVIGPKDEWGQRIEAPLLKQWQRLGGSLVDSFYYAPDSDFQTDIAHLLEVNTHSKHSRQDFDVIFLLAQPTAGHAIVPLLRYNYVINVPIYASSAIYAGNPNAAENNDLNGVQFCDIPWNLK